MRKTTIRGFALLPVILAIFAGLIYLGVDIYNNGDKWVQYHPLKQQTAQNEDAQNAKLPSGNIYDRNGTVLLNTDGGNLRYSDDYNIRVSTLHIVGDPLGNISTGAKTLFEDILTGYSFVDGLYNLKEYGRGNDIYLSVDANACATAYKALGKYNGAVGVYNYKTGELLCAVSKPSYDINDVPSDLLTNEKYNGVYLDRLFSARYTPGSTFKIVTALSAIENVPDIYSRTFTCKGKLDYGTGTVICHKSSGHGKLSFEEALNVSCNCAFAQIAEAVGKENLIETAESLGFNEKFVIDGINCAKSTFDLKNANTSDLAWAGIGQYKTIVTPAHMLMIAGAIANNGVGVTPYLLNKAVSPAEQITYSVSGVKNSSIVISQAYAEEMKTLLRSNVENEYGDSKFSGLNMCGKTGTAEYEGQDDYSWFVGFSQNEDTPYAVVVVAEQGGFGSYTAMSVASKTLNALVN